MTLTMDGRGRVVVGKMVCEHRLEFQNRFQGDCKALTFYARVVLAQ